MLRAAVALLVVILLASGAQADRRVALVVGNSAYQHAGTLTNPKNDATDVAAALKKLGFQIVEGFDLNKPTMEGKLREFARALTGSDVGLFFYAGHGLQVSGVNYLVPVDAKLEDASGLDFELVRLDLVQRSMERETRTNILFLDACRDNPLARNLARSMGTRSTAIGRGLANVEAGGGTLISFSTQPGNVALDGTGRNSPFAGALVKHVVAPGLDLGTILIRVRRDVMDATQSRQVPWEHSALTDTFFFSLAAAPSVQMLSEASREWARVDKASMAELETFVGRHGSSVEAAYARARIEELRKVSSATPPPAAKPAPAPEVKPAVQATPAPPLAAGTVFRDCPDCPEMVVVPAGKFMMGSPPNEEGRSDNEGPQRKVTIARPFAVGKYEVTFLEWDACLAGSGCKHNPAHESWGRGKRPVINVSWNDIKSEYLPWLSRKTGKTYRLLTEAEWEYAARAGTTTRYAFGDTINKVQAQYSQHTTVDVGSFQANAFGLYDVHGNVWEFVDDCWHGSYQGAPENGSAWTTDCPGNIRVLRGGSWFNNLLALRSAYRLGGPQVARVNSFGFRLARTLD